MHVRSAAAIVFLGLILPTGGTFKQQAAQQMPLRESQALAVLQSSFAAMGGSVPAE